ncbi:MlaD family protein [Nocardia sp. NPDC050175]|uniref:MlaD family protein n=1 Tax=Nocardia sp. NPDC050175 TaxID=3364317 RepID=UPI0037B7A5A8
MIRRLRTGVRSLLGQIAGTDTVPRNDRDAARSDLRWGTTGIVAVVVVLAALGIVYTTDLGVRTYTADLTDAGSVRAGDPVRIAGITVGKVRSLTLKSDRVALDFTVDRTIFVGAQTTLDIRMLTVVGGHYVALTPAGAQPLGRKTIPADHVTLPYSLPRAFQDAITPIRNMDGDVLRRNFAALADSIDKSPNGIGQALTAATTIVGILDKQSADISRALTVAEDYVSAIETNKRLVVRMVRTLGILITLIENNKLHVGKQLDLLASVVERVVPVGQAWQSTLKPMAQPLADLIPRLSDISTRLGELLEGLRAFGARFQPLITAQDGVAVDQSDITITAPALCIPVPGRTC